MNDTDTKKAEETVNTKGIMRRLFREVDGLYFNCFVGCIGAVVVGGIQAAFPWIIGEITSNFGRPTGGEIRDGALRLSLIFIALGVLSFIGSVLQFYFFGRFSSNIVGHMQKKYFKALLNQEMGFFDKESTGVLTAKISSEVTAMNNGFGQQIAMAIEKLFTGAIALGFALNYSWMFTLVLFGVLPFMILAMGLLSLLTMKMFSESEATFKKVVARSGEVLGGIRTVKSLNATHAEMKRFEVTVDEVKPIQRMGGLNMGAGLGITWFIMFAGMYGFGMWYGSTQVALFVDSSGADGLDGGAVLGVFFGVFMMAMGFGAAGPAFQEYTKAKAAAAYLFQTIDRKPELKTPSFAPRTEISGDIMLENVAFAYPTRPDVNVFDDFNISIKAGQTVALVGPSGSGKSTIVSMLERFYEPSAGKVLLDGHEIHEYDLKALRSQVGYVGQEPILFNMSIADNIKMGVEDQVSLDDIMHAAKMANAYDFIMGFPDGFDTIVGEKGSQMSGGQKQRISIARALCRKPKILLLDEATSALDTESEAIVQAALDKIMKNGDLTCIVIAHRLSTVKDADKIAVIYEGRVDQQGTHKELAADVNGIYATMLRAQQVIGTGSPRKSVRVTSPDMTSVRGTDFQHLEAMV